MMIDPQRHGTLKKWIFKYLQNWEFHPQVLLFFPHCTLEVTLLRPASPPEIKSKSETSFFALQKHSNLPIFQPTKAFFSHVSRKFQDFPRMFPGIPRIITAQTKAHRGDKAFTHGAHGRARDVRLNNGSRRVWWLSNFPSTEKKVRDAMEDIWNIC